jgi:hypothetical protein
LYPLAIPCGEVQKKTPDCSPPTMYFKRATGVDVTVDRRARPRVSPWTSAALALARIMRSGARGGPVVRRSYGPPLYPVGPSIRLYDAGGTRA